MKVINIKNILTFIVIAIFLLWLIKKSETDVAPLLSEKVEYKNGKFANSDGFEKSTDDQLVKKINRIKSNKAETIFKPNELEISKKIIRDENLITEIEQEMQFSERPEGDLSYMSPENETIQLHPDDVDFHTIEPENKNANLGERVTDSFKLGRSINIDEVNLP